jgi:hypothetical protein
MSKPSFLISGSFLMIALSASCAVSEEESTPGATGGKQALLGPQSPGDTALLRSEYATGWQIYACVNGALTFSRPYANLTGEIVHWGPGFDPDLLAAGPGPRWETYGGQGFSRIRGQVASSFPNENPAANIPDLLLDVVGSEGDGPLAGVVNIIRRGSTGGTAAVGSSCDPASGETWIDYSATYEFYTRQ